MPIVKGARSTIGGRTWGRMNPGGGHAGRISYELYPRMSALSQPKSLLNAGEQARGIKGLKSTGSARTAAAGWNQDAFVDLSHRDMDVLEAASQELADALQGYPIVRDIDDGFTPENRSTFPFYLPAEALGSHLKKSHVKCATHTMALKPFDNSADETKLRSKFAHLKNGIVNLALKS